MVTFLQALVLIAIVALLILASVFMGGWLVFKSKAGPGEGLLRTPKGQVFTIAEADDAEQFPDENETNILKKTEQFLKGIGG